MIKAMSVVAALLWAAAPALAAPARLETLTLSRSATGVERDCAQDQLCVQIASADCEGQACADVASDAGLSLQRPDSQDDPAHTRYRLSELASADENPSLRLWPQLIRFEGGILAGVEAQTSSSYSGGGAGASTLHLIAFLHGQAPFEILSVPLSGNAMIRACFDERDVKFRAEACHDVYEFDASLVPTGASAAGMPVLRYRSKATSFPGHVSRSRDSLAGRPLSQRDLVTVTDRKCSYRRLYRFSPKEGRYVTNPAPPDCSDYTVP